MVVGSICVVLMLYALWTMYRITCARRSHLELIKTGVEKRRASKWRVVRVVQAILDVKGPGSPCWAEINLIQVRVLGGGWGRLRVGGGGGREEGTCL